MNRRDFIGVFVSAGSWPTVAQASGRQKFRVVGYVDYEPPAVTMQGLLLGLRELLDTSKIKASDWSDNKLPARL